jgi:3-oxoacyl-[acyl-carrier protein] reductase
VSVKHKAEALQTLVLDTTITNQHGQTVLEGDARIMMLQVPETPAWKDTAAVVTGASRGIGAAVARALGENGTRVVVNYRGSADAAEAVVAEVKKAGSEAIAVRADVSTKKGARELADASLDAYGRVDLLVNNATPPIRRKGVMDLGWDELDRFWKTYVHSAFALSQAFVPGMKERGFGRIVQTLTSAIWGTPPPNTAGYVAAKSGLWGLTKTMALELAPFGITVNAVSPSAVMTDRCVGSSESHRRALAMSVPAQRLASPEEVAATVMFLITDGAYVTGANLPVAGGEVM